MNNGIRGIAIHRRVTVLNLLEQFAIGVIGALGQDLEQDESEQPVFLGFPPSPYTPSGVVSLASDAENTTALPALALRAMRGSGSSFPTDCAA